MKQTVRECRAAARRTGQPQPAAVDVYPLPGCPLCDEPLTRRRDGWTCVSCQIVIG